MEAKLKPARHKTVQNRSLSMPTRRKFLKTVGINAAGLTLWQQSLPALPAKPEKLNILWILAEVIRFKVKSFLSYRYAQKNDKSSLKT
jgi:hypothetical protein